MTQMEIEGKRFEAYCHETHTHARRTLLYVAVGRVKVEIYICSICSMTFNEELRKMCMNMNTQILS